ncbi:hypothetical protein [Peribacillus sp. SCS-37]|uniref:hypothetical protein n=1 Tax=Paraperibacillus esterisolvens TaxID=3115296 RepID=UPI0039057E04
MGLDFQHNFDLVYKGLKANLLFIANSHCQRGWEVPAVFVSKAYKILPLCRDAAVFEVEEPTYGCSIRFLFLFYLRKGVHYLREMKNTCGTGYSTPENINNSRIILRQS